MQTRRLTQRAATVLDVKAVAVFKLKTTNDQVIAEHRKGSWSGIIATKLAALTRITYPSCKRMRPIGTEIVSPKFDERDVREGLGGGHSHTGDSTTIDL